MFLLAVLGQSTEWLTPLNSIDTEESQQSDYESTEWLTPLNSIDIWERQQGGYESSEWLTPLNSIDTQDRQQSYYESEEWLKSQPKPVPFDDRPRNPVTGRVSHIIQGVLRVKLDRPSISGLG